MFESEPVAPMVTVAGFAVAAFVIVILSTALAVADEIRKGFPFASVTVVTFGVTKSGEVLKTRRLLPVSSVIAAAKFALDGVTKNVPIPVPKLDKPATGNPVALVRVSAEGIPRLGVVKTGFVAKTARPVPVSLVSNAARFALEGVPMKVSNPAAVVFDEHAPAPSSLSTCPAEPAGTQPVPPPPPTPPLTGDGRGVCAESARASVRPQSRRR